jgi:hypothetical protein
MRMIVRCDIFLMALAVHPQRERERERERKRERYREMGARFVRTAVSARAASGREPFHTTAPPCGP